MTQAQLNSININKIRTAFFIGIKGVGMAGLAYILDDMGIKIIGSDVEDDFVTADLLKDRGFKIYTSFSADLIDKLKPDIVITTGAHQGTLNPQFQRAVSLGIPALTQAQAVGWLMNQKTTGVSVAGVGGKTTISALISHILSQAGLDPAYLVGAGGIKPLIWPGRWGRGDYFIAEADEYATCPKTNHQPRFSWQQPKTLVLTNIEYDHPDVYKNLDQTLAVFTDFARRVLSSGGWLISYYDNSNNQTIINRLTGEGFTNIVTYGLEPTATWRLKPIKLTHPESQAKLEGPKAEFDLSLRLPGVFNLLNAGAAFITAYHLGIKPEKIGQTLSQFESIRRRFEFIGRTKTGLLIYDDYAHHPNEIKAALQAARQWFKDKRIGVVFQSHTISRTKQLLSDFANNLLLADDILIAPIYISAREISTNTNYQQKLLETIKPNLRPNQSLNLVNNPNQLRSILDRLYPAPQVLFTMGAGDIYKWGERLIFN